MPYQLNLFVQRSRPKLIIPGDVDELTIEALRAEVESDLAASGHDTAYDRKAKLINKAIMVCRIFFFGYPCR